jgi:peptidyl-dipeptidase A
MRVEDRARDFLADVERELKPLTIAAHLAEWEASTTGSPQAQERAAECEARLRKYLSSQERHRQIQELLASPQLVDPLLRRQLHLLALDHRPNLLPESVIDDLVRQGKRIESEFYTFRARLDGREVTNNEILEILRGELDEGRRKEAWKASKQIAPRVAEPLRALVERRNDAARSLGYRDFYAMRLQLQEIDETELFAVLRELEKATKEPFQRAKQAIDRRLAQRYGTSPEGVRPWHYEDPFFQEPPLSEDLALTEFFRDRDLVTIADRFYLGIGLPVRDILDRSDLYERERKDQHAYCTNIDRDGDVRILCNLRQDERWMMILLHELGHAAYEKFIPRGLPWLLRQSAHISSTEAVAMFMDRLIYDVEWLSRAVDVDVEDAGWLQERTWQSLRFEMLLMARWVLVMTYFERELYANPQREDLDAFWWDLVEELQMVPRPEGRAGPDWAAKIHLTVAPVYYHNYLLGELTASQLSSYLRRDVLNGQAAHGYVGLEELGSFLSERIFRRGAAVDWQTLLQEATGSRLSATPFLEEFVTLPESVQPPRG